MANNLKGDLEKILATMAAFFADEGQTREVAILALSRNCLKHEGEDYNIDHWTVCLEVPRHLYAQISEDRNTIQQALETKANELTLMYPTDFLHFTLVTELEDDPEWREKAKAFVTGQGITNQGRARSDNLAPRLCDGLLFRSEQEINLYRALKSAGVAFAPLPVFIRGGKTYQRIEPDFVVIKDGIVLIIEVDGDTVHHETPREAHDRLTMLTHEDVKVERVNAKECETPEKAKECATKILRIIEKLKTNK